MIKHWIVVFLFLFGKIQADHANVDPFVLSVTEGEPHLKICDSVNPITGSFYLSRDDIVVAGVEPLRVPSLYSLLTEGNTGWRKKAGWNLVPHQQLVLMTCTDEKTHRITVADKNGSTMTFDRKTHHHYECDLLKHGPGITNDAKGMISARTNLRNYRIVHSGDWMSLYCADGTERRYKYYETDKPTKCDTYKTFLLQWEKLPNGNWIHYGYDKHDRLDYMNTTNPDQTKVYAWVRLSYEDKALINPDFRIETSDGRTLHYEFYCNTYKDKRKYDNDVFLLNKITKNFAPLETFSYEPGKNGDDPRINEVAYLKDKYLRVAYYYDNDNDVGGEHVTLSGNDCRRNRVKTLSAPVGPDSSPIITHRFFYDPNHKYSDGYKNDCFTRVFDIENNLTTIHANRYGRPIEVQWFHYKNGTQQLKCSEKSVWSDHYLEIGNLKQKTFCDENGIEELSRLLNYDRAGNVLSELTRGNLSGESPSQVDVTTYGYTPNHLMAWKRESNGRKTLFSYVSSTDKISSRFTCNGDAIKIREFFDYDSDLLLRRIIQDNGSTTDPNNLSGVTQRRIRLITTRSSAPNYGFPEVIEDRYLENGQEKLLRKTHLTYHLSGKVSSVEVYDTNGAFQYRLNKEYDSEGHLIAETNPLGQITRYKYDAWGNQTEITDGRTTTQNQFDAMNRLISTSEKGDDGLSRTTYHTYNLKNQKSSTTDTNRHTTHFTYDPFNNLLATELPTSTTLSSIYDAFNRPVSQTDGNGDTISQEYNARGKPIHITYPDGTEESFIYNINGSLRAHRQKSGTTVYFVYDFMGRMISKRQFSTKKNLLSSESWSYDAFNLLSHTNAAGFTTTYTYDGAGRKIAETYADETTSYAYDSLGRVSQVQQGDQVTITEYDLVNRITEKRTEDLSGAPLTRINFGYDRAGNQSEITRYSEQGPLIELTLFDSFKRPIRHVDALGHVTVSEYNDHFINETGEEVVQKTTTDPEGTQSIETYDILHQLASLELKNSFGELLHFEAYTYDASGNKIRQETTVIIPRAPPKTITTLWQYGPLNRILTLTEAAGSSDQRTTTYSYAADGLLHQLHKPNGITLTYTYDPLQRLEELTSSDNSCHYRYHYNDLNQPELIEDLITGTTTLREYDPHSRLIREKLGNNLTLSTSYDELGRKASLTLPDYSSIVYTYQGFLSEISRYSSRHELLYSHTYTKFDERGQLVEQNLIGNLGTVQFEVDGVGRTDSLTSPHFNTAASYSPRGNLLALQEDDQIFHYSYDDLSQLTAEHNHSYSYDSTHNRLSKDEASFHHNDLNQLSDFTYDLNGNPLSDGTRTFTYDALDRLTSITSPTHRALFTYDAFHRRLTKQLFHFNHGRWIEASHLRYLYDGENEIGAADHHGTLVELRVLGLGKGAEIGAAISLELYGTTYAPIHDLRGNIVKLLTLSGEIAASYTYTAFGEETASSNLPNPWRYCSKRTDTEFNLVYFGRRYYSPSHGRWLTPDPKGFTDGMNLYAYVHNNPYLKLDLYGLEGVAYNINFSLSLTECAQIGSVVASMIGQGLNALGTHVIPNHLGGNLLSSLGQLLSTGEVRPTVHSDVYEVGYRDAADVAITVMNGIMNSRREGEQAASFISETHGDARVRMIYNSSHGFITDILQVILGKLGIATRPARLLAQEWRSKLQDFDSKGTAGSILHYTHSGGGTLTENALHLLTPEERARIKIYTFGSATLFSKELARDVLHYVSVRDGVPMTSFMSYIRAASSPASSNVQFIRNFKGMPFADHSLIGGSYAERITKFGEKFQEKYF